ncbi:hypothetical protein [Novipirellula caenicola]|uniref:hypothetical protein n=1 Tax=Novipirellula caenicola TaxID=1536901 RepID=UPI0031EDA8E1
MTIKRDARQRLGKPSDNAAERRSGTAAATNIRSLSVAGTASLFRDLVRPAELHLLWRSIVMHANGLESRATMQRSEDPASQRQRT